MSIARPRTWSVAVGSRRSLRRVGLWAVLLLAVSGCMPAAAPTGQPSASASIASATPGASETATPAASESSMPSLAGIELVSSKLPRAAAAPADARAAAAAINAFGFDLYGRIGKSGDNKVISPASIAIALGMARTGARGATAAEMDRVLRDVAAESHANWLNSLDSALASRSGTFEDAARKPQRISLNLANAQFAQSGMHFERAFLDALAQRYAAGVRLVDYRRDPEAARGLINAWVSDRTEARIRELLARGYVTSDTRLTLVNAVYLKAPWLIPFDEPSNGPFTRLDGSRVTVPLMHMGAGPLMIRAARSSNWQAVELPYVGQHLAMLVIVPRDYHAYARRLDAGAIGEIDAALRTHAVDLVMPKFKVETRADLADFLDAMGMRLAFTPEADFSAITGARDLKIAFVVHQANIDVDENGTEAAAATAVGFDTSGGGPEPFVIRADRPFFFALRDVPTGAILFLGSVTDPSK